MRVGRATAVWRRRTGGDRCRVDVGDVAKASRIFRKVLGVAIMMVLVVMSACSARAVNTENYYFENFEGDYYLTSDVAGVSMLRVVESFTAVFPDYNQNKGICRDIPFTNQGGINTTLRQLTKNDIKVQRNGISEPIYSIDRYDNYYEVCTGTDEYIKGKQVFTFEYSFERVVTEFDNYQELYWDTNGNGWRQKFNQVTARVHFADDTARRGFDGGKWCYVGKYGENGSERCEIREIQDGVEFSTQGLAAGENLTFDVQFRLGTFTVPEPERSFILVWIMVGVGAVCALISGLMLRKFWKVRDKAKYYKDYFVKPEYQPSREYSLAEMAENYIGTKQDTKAALMLDLAVRKKISIVKLTGVSAKWAVKVESLDGVCEEERILLDILNGGQPVAVGDEIPLKSRIANSTLVKLGRQFTNMVTSDLKRDGLAESNKRAKGDPNGNTTFTAVIMVATMIVIGWAFVGSGNIGEIAPGKVLVGVDYFVPVVGIIVIGTLILSGILSDQTSRYATRTLKGLEASRYMDGLKLYIEMAEADRLKFLQSVKGADISPTGIVKLYERLLPYAAVFGLEKSWMRELAEYARINNLPENDWYNSDIILASHLASSCVRSSTTYMSSSGGSSSSGFSGGGGGGFSGGGGGGGGGHGR